ncbi:hypothetical protein K1T73_14870 [Roseovarius sp. SCSIO 43702]|uniref:hypothetical protein n=1 Tax=Roseovarius sp. SCSIO 43702 TaxID=2823043 RepID=UPI001C73BAEC|nr:hypothetical protein [Roseovarius sp. SCSIO 43702]QYX56321.1 hypothetical protein K1T73_14870 [Roseovarius sp. SCSIO 43702]
MAQHEQFSDLDLERTVCADVVALDQLLVYNRFGSFNPYGMIFALRRDVAPMSKLPEHITADACDTLLGTEAGGGVLEPGKVRLKDCKRPRPLTLRANVGDLLHVRLDNLLRESAPGISETFCRTPENESSGVLRRLRDWVSRGDETQVGHGEALCDEAKLPQSPDPTAEGGDWPATRTVNFAIQGLRAVVPGGGTPDDRCVGLKPVLQGDPVDCYYAVLREGPYFLASTAAPSGGEGDGGSLTHGLFGAVVVQPSDTDWYRSQVSRAAFDTAWTVSRLGDGRLDAVSDAGDLSPYEAEDPDTDVPILNMLQEIEDDAYQLVHSDLNAIIHRPPGNRDDDDDEDGDDDYAAREKNGEEGKDDDDDDDDDDRDSGDDGDEGVVYREFSVFFHDELKSFVTRNYEELGLFAEGQLAGVKDGFAINYGASGMGAMVVANRKGIGPAADCIECLYEEFFLTSWANGDPALLEQFSDDPSNVHHSYLNDPVVFRNFHAGPKETHVFHLHAHQWFSGNDTNRGAYLDSQTVAPQQGFTYRIYGGGMEIYRRGQDGEGGWYDTLGSGNRNRTVGDSIFHCHLYPHFAQGMWELWRVHDTLEDGSRKLPDGQSEPGLSLAEMAQEVRAMSRPGSVDPVTGAWNAPQTDADGEPVARALGTPIPAIVPLPGQPWPVLPTYGDPDTPADAEVVDAMPGYPFYIAGRPGHRPPQPPMDIARDPVDGPGDEFLDGGLPRHVVASGNRKFPFDIPDLAPDPTAGSLEEAWNGGAKSPREIRQEQIVAKALALGDMSMKIDTMTLDLLEYDGTPLERAAMAFHHDGAGLTLKAADGSPTTFDPTGGGYASPGGLYAVNGAPGKPGAPYADPCGAPDSYANVSASGGTYEHQGRTVFFVDGDVDLTTTVIAEADRKEATALEVTRWVRRLAPDAAPADRPRLYTVDAGGDQVEITGPVQIAEADPLVAGTDLAGIFTAEPAVVGYRRYEASAVQLDLVTNRAGWHDPQARINVLTANSGGYKDDTPAGEGRISPVISASEEPFFFRAVSGECIEFRHTNELPKELELDDFQVKTPTDTIGQHIHLVKFDVTSSDGSGNGFNYEDGTFAPDEIALRICAAKNAGMSTNPNRAPSALELRELDGLCVQEDGVWHVADDFKDIWRRELQAGENRKLFQTTVQRWFADPILSATRADGEGDGMADRTLKTVFSHDHFGPSSIQQHGFYTALVIEPQRSRTCPPDSAGTGTGCTDQRNDRALVVADDRDVGVRKVIFDPDAVDTFDPTLLDPDVLASLGGPASIEDRTYREFALAVADFALLYDPRDQLTVAEFEDALAPEPGLGADEQEGHSFKGMGTLVCEATYQGDPEKLKDVCGSAIEVDGSRPDVLFAPGGNAPPAWIANGRAGDIKGVAGLPDHDLSPGAAITASELEGLSAHMLAYRQRAAGHDPQANPDAPLAKPVVAPQRPESISVDHHDPYLVNYRGEPIPLRIGEGASASESCALKAPEDWVSDLQTGVTDTCSVRKQRAGDAGDMANVFLSQVHGDPATPIFESLSGDKVQFRLIQGAQEVQHTFKLEGYTWPRHVDQSFPTGFPGLDDITPDGTLTHACARLDAARSGRPDQYSTWLRLGPDAFADGSDHDYWSEHESFLAECFNATGRIPAQEVGISEHFEFQGVFRQEASGLEAAQATEDRPSDTLLHFGSIDALWNGAWGIFRVHKSAAETGLVALEGGRESALGPDTFPATQVFGCSQDAPRVHAAAIAIEAGTVFGQLAEAGDWGTPYGPRHFDRNGLFLALVDPRILLDPDDPGSVTPSELTDTQSWQDIPLAVIKTAILDKYDRPEPFVLPLNAGDCVKLVVLNALRDTGEGDPSGLPDDLGDARMPPIVPLNVEPVWQQIAGGENSPATYEQVETVNIRPSSRLALTIPLPILNHRQNVSTPFGGNGTWALAGISPDPDATLSLCNVPGGGGAPGACIDQPDQPRESQIELLTFYAGRASAPKDLDFDPLPGVSDAFEPAFTSGDPAWTQIRSAAEAEGFAAFGEISPSEQPDAVFRVAGRPVDIGVLVMTGGTPQPQVLRNVLPAGLHPALQSLLDDLTDEAEAEIRDRVHFIPYAYGALPIQSVGDIVGHATHGLFGSVNIMPQSARLQSGQTLTEISPNNFVVAPVASAPVWSSRIETTFDGEQHQIRQFTLFWQDGLNLRDSDSADVFNGFLPPGETTPTTPQLVAECEVCDDSYDLGDQGVNYRSASFARELRGVNGNGPTVERHYNLNALDFGDGVFRADAATPVLRAEAGEEVVIHLVHPGGRARQRAFVTVAQDYDDLFPGFGFPHSALLAPGKSTTASLTEVMREGCYVWFDGPLHLRSGGTWGLLDVVPAGSIGDADVTSCQ